jgi:membrane protease YdiL (CAAX protease family)
LKEADRPRTIGTEVLLVLGVSLGYSAVYALVDLIGKLTAHKALSSQTTTLNPSAASGHPWLDLAFQLVQIFFGVVPALLALHLLKRGGQAHQTGLQNRRIGFDVGWGAGLAAAIGIPGLGLYLATRAIGINTTVVPEALPLLWWTVPVLLLSAVQNAFLEEVVVVGYLTIRLREISWSLPLVVAASALLRGAYHLYQGFGGFIGNAVMGTVFALFFIRFKRVGPLIIAHAILDSVAFVGFALLRGHLSALGL